MEINGHKLDCAIRFYEEKNPMFVVKTRKKGRLLEVLMFKADEFPDQCHKLGLL